MALEAPRFPGVISATKPDAPSQTSEEVPEPLGLDDPLPLDERDVVQILEGYRLEARNARLAGPSSRDRIWLEHWDLYYNRWDFSKKAPWQAKEVLPEFPQYVDRFAAAMRMALVGQPQFFTVSIDNDTEAAMGTVIRKFMEVILRRIGRNPSGHRVDFSAFFEELMKMGALSMCVAKVTQKSDGEGTSYTGIDVIDPYNYWLDPTGRNLYRQHREEVDLHQLRAMLEAVDDTGSPLFDPVQGRRAMQAILAENSGQGDQAIYRQEKEKRTGTSQWYTSSRKPVIVDEWYCDLVDNQGFLRAQNCLFMVVNETYLVRGMSKDGTIGEPNPFWHGKDWMVAAPIITVPLAPYGRSYAENFACITKTFNETTNLILDGIMASTLKIFGLIPGNLEDPSQLEDGLSPNMVLRFIEGVEAEKSLFSVDMGALDKQAFDVWQLLKKELQEGAAFNDMTLGNSAPQARTSATEINTVDQNSTQYMRAIAANVETLVLEPLLDLIWKTAIQHLDKKDEEIRVAVGDQWFKTFLKTKKKLAKSKITFVCRGITSLLARKQKLSEFLQMLQICAQNPQMTQVLVQTWTPQKLFSYLAMLLDVDVAQLEATPQDKMLQQQQDQQNQQKQQQAMQQDAAHKGLVEQGKAQAKGAANFQEKSKLAILQHLLDDRMGDKDMGRELKSKLFDMLMGGGQPAPGEGGEEPQGDQGGEGGEQQAGPSGP